MVILYVVFCSIVIVVFTTRNSVESAVESGFLFVASAGIMKYDCQSPLASRAGGFELHGACAV